MTICRHFEEGAFFLIAKEVLLRNGEENALLA